MKYIVLLLTMLLVSFSCFAQFHHHKDHKEHEHYHIESKIGIGAATSFVYDMGEQEFAPGFHVHMLRVFNEKFGAGIGYEGIIGDNYHQTLTAFGKFFLTDFLSVNVGPGLTLPNKEHNEFSLSAHFELATAFDICDIHVGPMVGYGISTEDSHVSLGLHVGWHF
ncbi:MAG: hypothetical protein PF541_08115 [Prolixibacteraceae bacterium]|jgi:hypothetical protein|nr:hypothetical protein [Prolixibacteraceae bacterium]